MNPAPWWKDRVGEWEIRNKSQLYAVYNNASPGSRTYAV